VEQQLPGFQSSKEKVFGPLLLMRLLLQLTAQQH
jgi:hypothetical protein